MINDIDFRTEQVLSKEFFLDVEVEQLNSMREAIISRVRQVQDHNLAHLNKTYKENEFERMTEAEIDSRLFSKFCFLI